MKPFDDPKVREAVSYAINRTSVVNAAGGSSLAEPATTFLPDQAAFGYTPYDAFPAGRTGDPAKARQLLAQAGHPHGLTITLTHSTSDVGNEGPAVATAVQDGLKAAGITLKLDGLDQDRYDDTDPPGQERAGDVPGRLGRRLALRRPVPRPDLRRPPDRPGRLQLQLRPTRRPDDQPDDRPHQRHHRPRDRREAVGRTRPRSSARKALTVPLVHPVYKRLYGKDVRDVVISDWTGVLDTSQAAVR